MDLVSYYRCDMSRAEVMSSPFPFHALQLSLTHVHLRFINSGHSPQEVAPPFTEFLNFRIPQNCFSYPGPAFDYLAGLMESLGLNLGRPDISRLVLCICGGVHKLGGGSVVVLATMTVTREDVMQLGLSEETLILDAVSPSRSSSGAVGENLTQVKSEGEAVGDGDGDCPICLDEFTEGSTVIRTPCSHLFHDECIKTWMKKKRRKNKKPDCPLCRSQLAA